MGELYSSQGRLTRDKMVCWGEMGIQETAVIKQNIVIVLLNDNDEWS